MKLSDFSLGGDLVRDGDFVVLGRVDSTTRGTLAYYDTVCHSATACLNSNISFVITTRELAAKAHPQQGLFISTSPRNTFYELHRLILNASLYGSSVQNHLGVSCVIHPSAIISEKTHIGDRVRIYERAVIRDEVYIGDGTVVDAGAIIGAEGLLCTMENGAFRHVEHAGGVHIGRNVTVLSNSVIAKSIHNQTYTTIEDGAVIGISTTIGHEAYIGKNCVISGNCVIARNAHIEEGAWIGSSCVVREHVRVGKFAKVSAGSIVIDDVNENTSVSGNFAIDHKLNLMEYVRMRNEISRRHDGSKRAYLCYPPNTFPNSKIGTKVSVK